MSALAAARADDGDTNARLTRNRLLRLSRRREARRKRPSYRRALWNVVILNLGFGFVEIVGGFIANSQALKADALDFLGDGSITLVGLLALG